MGTPNRYVIPAISIHDAVDVFVEAFAESDGDLLVELPSGHTMLYGVESLELSGMTFHFREVADIVGDVTPDTPEPPEPPPLRWGKVTAQPNLYVRYEPGGDWVGRLPFDTRVPLLEERDGWYMVPVDAIGGHGWVSGRYITEISEGE